MTCGIYSITNKINGKRLIGSSSNIERRWCAHRNMLAKNAHNNKHIQNSYIKYGKENILYEIINICDIKNLIEFEDYFILAFNSMNNKFGYNLISASRHVTSNETRIKMSKSATGRKLSKETINKVRISSTGRKHTEESKKKLSMAKMGINNPMYGKKRTKESREKMSLIIKKSWEKRRHTC